MATKLPTAARLGPRQAPRSQRAISTVDPQTDGGAMASAAAGIGQKLVKVADRMYSREESIDRIDKSNALTQFVTEKFQQFSDVGDISDPRQVGDYNKAITDKMEELIQGHSGRSDSATVLRGNLSSILADAKGRATGESIKAQNEKLKIYLNDQSDSYAQGASNNPDAFDDQISNFDREISQNSGALSSVQELAYRAAGKNKIARSALDALLSGGQIDGVESFLSRADIAGYLGPEGVTEYRRAASEAMRMQNESISDVVALQQQTRMAFGRDPTPDEYRSVIFGAPDQQKLLPVQGPDGSIRYVPQDQAIGGLVPPKQPLVQMGDNFGAIPPGFQRITDPQSGAVRMEPIPGSPAAMKLEAAQSGATNRNVAAHTAALQAGGAVIDSVNNIFDIMMDDTFIPAVGPLSGPLTSLIPGTPARQVELHLNTIKSNVAFDRLQAMRESSPTGGALGSVSQSELKLLESSVGPLSTELAPDKFAQQMVKITEIYGRIIYGSDAELAVALEQGAITPAQAHLAAEQRDRMVQSAQDRSDQISGAVETRKDQPYGKLSDEELGAVKDRLANDPEFNPNSELLSKLSDDQLADLESTWQASRTRSEGE